MDTRTGDIYTPEKIEKIRQAYKNGDKAFGTLLDHLKEMKIPPTEAQWKRIPPRVGRNDPCPCGSGKKFKKCCMEKE